MTTQQERINVTYRLKRKIFTPKLKRVLEALDTWIENNPDRATCQQIADIAGVSQTYVQRIIRPLEATGYVKLQRRYDGTLDVPGIFVVRGWKLMPRLLKGTEDE